MERWPLYPRFVQRRLPQVSWTSPQPFQGEGYGSRQSLDVCSVVPVSKEAGGFDEPTHLRKPSSQALQLHGSASFSVWVIQPRTEAHASQHAERHAPEDAEEHGRLATH